jgi:hypothetical protein
MKILVKFPTRSRPERFFNSLDSIYEKAYDLHNLYVLVSADTDDETMNNEAVLERVRRYSNIAVVFGTSKSKIDAVNRDVNEVAEIMPAAADWEILVVMSDDFLFLMPNWDEIIRSEIMLGGLDTLLHLPDQDAKHLLATMYIAGRTFYDRFGYIYDQRFRSLFCDNLIQDIAIILQKYRFVNMQGVIAHLNPAYGHLERDEMFNRQQDDWPQDEATYLAIKGRGYELDKLKYL